MKTLPAVLLACALALPAFAANDEKETDRVKESGIVLKEILNIPDDIAARLQPNDGDISRRLLEMAALEGYRSGELTAYQVQQMLGLQTRMEVDDFLKRHEVYPGYSDEELAHEAETSRRIKETLTKP